MQGAPDVYAITNARIVPVSGAVIPRGTVVVRDGLIEAVGANVAAPADARTLDGTGLTVYPAMVDGFTKLGMPQAADYTVTPRGDAYPVASVRAENDATALLKPDPATFDVRRKLGWGAALTAPGVGVFSGTGAVISLRSANAASDLVIKAPVASYVNFAAPDPTGGYPNSLMGEVALTRQALYDAQDAARRIADYEKNPNGKARPKISRALLSLVSVVNKQRPLIIRGASALSIRRALKLCAEFGLHPVIEGGGEAYRVTDLLKTADAAVLLSADLPEAPRVAPGDDDPSTLQGYRSRALAPNSAALLARAGVPFAFTTNGMTNPADFARNVRRMIAAGLTQDKAVEAATLAPARLLGVDRQLGSVEKGKIANLIVATGDLFGEKTKIKYVFTDGEEEEIDATPAAAPAPGGRGGGAANAAARAAMLAALPPGVTVEMAREALETNPQVAQRFLPAGVTLEQARAALADPAAPPTGTATETVKAPPPVGDGLVPPLPPQVATSFVLRGATVWTVGPQGTLPVADVYVVNGKIAAVGTNLAVPAGVAEIDARGKSVTPGMIDCHSHTAIEGGVNEGSNIVTAEVRIGDVINAEDINIYRQLAGGTTAANLLHGSANAIGGQNAVVKWRWGATPDEMLLKQAPPGIKFALGENPKQSNYSAPTSRYPASRMGVEKVIRQSFGRARDYQAQWKAFRDGKTALAPRRDLQLDALVEVLEGKRLVHCHSYRQDEILMMVRVADEYGFKMATFQHVLEGYKVADELARHGAGASTFSDWWAFKIEAYDAIPYNGALMSARGVVTSFNSDDSELARRLNLEAAKAIHWGGMTPDDAIKLVTINPAKQLRIDKYVGSLEAGKDADLVVWSGDPLSTISVCEKTFVDGKLYFDRQSDLAARPILDVEKKRLALAERPAPAGARTPPSTAPAAPNGAGAGTVAAAAAAAAPSLPLAITVKKTVADNNAPLTAVVGGTVHPVSGPEIANGVVVMQGGKIRAVGGADTLVPPGATVITATGLHVYPGMIDADTELGLTEIESIRATNDSREMGDFNPELRALIAVNPDSELIPVARANGILTAITAPSGGVMSGMGALINLDGWTWEDMAVTPTSGLYLNYPASGPRRFRETSHRCEETAGSPDDALAADPAFRSGAFVPAGSHDTDALRFGLYPETTQGTVAAPQQQTAPPPAPGAAPPVSSVTDSALRRRQRTSDRTSDPVAPPAADEALRPLNNFFDEARRYQTAVGAQGKPGAQVLRDRDPRFEAMASVIGGANIPVWVRADREKDIRGAIAWAKKNNVKIVIVGAQEADKCADLLAREHVPVVLGPVLSLPARWDSPYDDPYSLPARLAKAGVTFCLSTGGGADVRRLPYQAAMASAFGLPRDEALKAITLYPAQIAGVADRLGSLEPGKDANLLITTGNPLEITSVVKSAFIAGRPVDLNNKHLRLYEKYKSRPLPTVSR